MVVDEEFAQYAHSYVTVTLTSLVQLAAPPAGS